MANRIDTPPNSEVREVCLDGPLLPFFACPLFFPNPDTHFVPTWPPALFSSLRKSCTLHLCSQISLWHLCECLQVKVLPQEFALCIIYLLLSYLLGGGAGSWVGWGGEGCQRWSKQVENRDASGLNVPRLSAPACVCVSRFLSSAPHSPQPALALYFPNGASVAPTRLSSLRAQSVSVLFLDSQAQNKHSVSVHWMNRWIEVGL